MRTGSNSVSDTFGVHFAFFCGSWVVSVSATSDSVYETSDSEFSVCSETLHSETSSHSSELKKFCEAEEVSKNNAFAFLALFLKNLNLSKGNTFSQKKKLFRGTNGLSLLVS